jgi:hypothetical protein
MTSIGGTQVQSTISYVAPGDYYACVSDNPMSEGVPGKDVCRDIDDHFPNVTVLSRGDGFAAAVTASGSPFPIYPHRVIDFAHQQEPRIGVFIDGGYAHLVPLEGAEIAGADAVLVVRSAARLDAHPVAGGQHFVTAGSLLTDLPHVASLLYDRSQKIDNSVGNRMFVASLAPDDAHGSAPFLMDFRPMTLKRLVADATDDFENGRIGRVESWGLPSTRPVNVISSEVKR